MTAIVAALPDAPHPLLAGATGAAAAAGAALTAYAVWEARPYTLRRVEVPLLPAGARPLRVLHLSDIHMTPGQARKQEWLAGLATLRPDLVVNTGDNLSHAAVGAGRARLPGRAARRARGSSSSAPTTTSAPPCATRCATCCPTTATATPTRRGCRGPTCATRSPRPAGPTSPTAATSVKVGELSFAFAGVDDPHLRYDRLDDVAGPADPDADVRLGVAHAPYLRVLDQYAADGYDAILAGHTHGGQVCLPGVGALTTNCDLEPARAKGLHRHPADSRDGDPGSVVAARLGRHRHLAVRPDPGRLPPRGHAADPGPPDAPDRLGNALPAPVCSRPCEPSSHRAVAQLGSAPRSGRGGRRFKSCQPDFQTRRLPVAGATGSLRVQRRGEPREVGCASRVGPIGTGAVRADAVLDVEVRSGGVGVRTVVRAAEPLPGGLPGDAERLADLRIGEVPARGSRRPTRAGSGPPGRRSPRSAAAGRACRRPTSSRRTIR